MAKRIVASVIISLVLSGTASAQLPPNESICTPEGRCTGQVIKSYTGPTRVPEPSTQDAVVVELPEAVVAQPTFAG